MIKLTIPTTFNAGFEEFLYSRKVAGCRDITIKHYQNSIHVFQLYFDELKMDDIEENIIAKFFCLLQERGLSDQTISTYIRDLRTVLYYFMEQEWIEQFKIKLPHSNKSFKQIYTDEELKILLSKPKIKKCTFAEYRDWTIINYIMGTGQRVSTILNIQNGDIDLENGMVYLRHLKNRQQIVLPLTASLVQVLREYMRIRGGDQNDYLFCTVYGEQLTRSALTSSIRRYNRKRGVSKTSIHLMRHTFAVRWIRESGDVVKLQRMLTHSDLKTTQLYLDLVYDDLKQNMEDVNPLEKLKMKSEKIPGVDFS